MDHLLRDLRHGARSLLRSPALTAVSVLALTLGIGLTTTMFSIVYGALFRGLPFEQSERIMHLERNNLSKDLTSLEVTIHDFHDWRAQQRSFEGLAGFYEGTVNVSGTGDRPERFDGAFISANAFQLLRVRPHLGRLIREDEDEPGAAPVILLGHHVWQNHFDGDPGVIGRTIRVNGEPAEIIGVMPEGFQFPINQDVWVPLRVDPLKTPRGEGTTLEVIGRLKAGVSIDQAALDMSAVARRIAADNPKTNEGVGAVVQPFIHEYIGDEPRTMLYTMLGAVFFVLLIACANVANLLLGRAVHRTKEIGIRTALGATRASVARQFLTEALLLALVGAVLGVAMAYGGVTWFNRAIASTEPPYWINIRVDLVALGFALGAALLATVASGLLPALQASRADINEVLKDETRGSSSFRVGKLSKGLVMFEMALSCGLLVGAGLMIKSVTNLRTVDYGFATEKIFTARVGLPEVQYPDSASRVRFFTELESKLAELPGAEASALTNVLPAVGGWVERFAVEGKAYAKDEDFPQSRWASVTPGYFDTFGLSLLQGRGLTAQDREGSLPVAVVNQSFARKHFGGESPVGRRIRVGTAESTRPWMTIVGVVPDTYVRQGDDDDVGPEAMYVPFAQNPLRFVSVAARTRGNPAELTARVRDAVASIDPDLPIYWARPLSEAIAQETWFYRVFGTLFMIFGGVALFLAAVGLYAVMAFAVSRRAREVGVRMALGAQTRDVVGLVFRQGLTQIAVGMVLGLAFAAGVSSLVKMLLFEVEPRDPTIFAGVVVVLTAAGLLACLVPARRAASVDPMIALRQE